MTQKEAQLLILNDVINYYNLGNRSAREDGGCLYNGPDGKHCAAARWMTDPSEANETTLNTSEHFDLLKPEAQLAGIPFMQSIQDLHDYTNNWTETGLSFVGEKYVRYIKIKYNL